METFEIKKSFVGYESKNKLLFTGNYNECKEYMSYLINTSRKNGADMVSSNDEGYVCENYDDNGATVVFEILKK